MLYSLSYYTTSTCDFHALYTDWYSEHSKHGNNFSQSSLSQRKVLKMFVIPLRKPANHDEMFHTVSKVFCSVCLFPRLGSYDYNIVMHPNEHYSVASLFSHLKGTMKTSLQCKYTLVYIYLCLHTTMFQ